MSRTKKTLLVVLGLALILFVYSFFFTDGPDPLLSIEEPALAQKDIKGRELLTVLLGLNRITLDEEIFSSELFTALQDFSIVLPESEAAGRPNPFAPIGVQGE